MPANPSGPARSRKNPQYRKRSPTRTGITRFMLMRYPRLQRMIWHRAREHEEHEREDEAVVPVPEGGIIFPERIDPGKKQERRHESNHDERDEADACRFSHGAIRLTRVIPVRDHLVGEHRVRDERDEMRPAMIASRMGFMPGGGFRWVMKMGEVPGPGLMERGFRKRSGGAFPLK
jgi:hypothetical protein